jgi:hypothetical protein
MQIISKMLLVPMLFFVLQTNKCNTEEVNVPVNQNATVNLKVVQNVASGMPFPIEYDLLTKNCFDDSSCLAFIYVARKDFNTKKLIELLKHLNDKNPKKTKLSIFFFDNLVMGNAFAKSKRELRDLENYANAWFLYNSKEEYLKIRISDNESENWSSWKTVYQKNLEK